MQLREALLESHLWSALRSGKVTAATNALRSRF
jgi:hypothetical protein